MRSRSCAHFEHRHVFFVQAERVDRHVDGAHPQLRIHELAIHDRALAHRGPLRAHFAQHRVAFDRDAFGLSEGQVGRDRARRQRRRGHEQDARGDHARSIKSAMKRHAAHSTKTRRTGDSRR
jgi:hypothetical protein